MTPEDEALAWLWVARKFSDAYGSTARAWNILGTTLQDGDRADAELILYAQQHRNRRACYVGQTWVEYRGKSFL